MVNSVQRQSDNQFQAILSYAKLKGEGKRNKDSGGHQYIPFAMYVSAKKVPDRKEQKYKNWAMKQYGVYLEILDFGR